MSLSACPSAIRDIVEGRGSRHEAHTSPNGSGGLGCVTQLLELEQHSKRALQLAVYVRLVARQLVEPVRLKDLSESLGAEKGPVPQLLAPVVVPWTDLLPGKAGEAASRL